MSEKSHQDVSRETHPDTPMTPEQEMLNNIMDRAMAEREAASKESLPNQGGEQEDVSRETPRSEKPSSIKNKRSSVYVYLAVLFGAAFLMLLLAYFVQQRNNALNDLRSSTASREELLENIKALEEEREQLQKKVEEQKNQVAQKNEENKQLLSAIDDSYTLWDNQRIQLMTLKYVWYIDQFIENKEYPMASAAVLFFADSYRNQDSINPAQVKQYKAYRQELIDRGYLRQLDHFRDGGTDIWFTDKWNPSQNEDMAALCILWCALEQHFIAGSDEGASQYLYLYPLGNPATGYQERVERLASDFTLEQFQLMKDELVEENWLVIAEDGTMSEGNYMGAKNDMLYCLPFELPEEQENG